MSDGNQLADDVPPEHPDLSVRFLSFRCCSKYCSCSSSCVPRSFSHSPSFSTCQCWRHLLSFNSFCLMNTRQRAIVTESAVPYRKDISLWIRFKLYYVPHAVAEVSQVRLSLARMSPLCTVDIRIRSPLQPHYCTLSKNRKPKIDSRRRYKLYEIYWVWEETIAAAAHGWPSGKTVESNSVDWIVSTLSGEDLPRSKLLVPCDQSSDDIVRSHARDWRVFKYIRK